MQVSLSILYLTILKSCLLESQMQLSHAQIVQSSIDVKFYSKFPSLSHGSPVYGIFIDCHQHAVKEREGINININLPIAWQWGLVGIYRLSSTRNRTT